MENQSDAPDSGQGSGSLSGDQGAEDRGLVNIRQQLQLCASTLQQLAGSLAVSLPLHRPAASLSLSPVVSRESSQQGKYPIP